jgi:hypothetical protein
LIHIGDSRTVVDPETLPARLKSAGLDRENTLNGNGVTNPVEDDSFHGRIVRGGAATRSHRDQPVTCAVHE